MPYPSVALLLDMLGKGAQFGVETVPADVPDDLASDACHCDDPVAVRIEVCTTFH